MRKVAERLCFCSQGCRAVPRKQRTHVSETYQGVLFCRTIKHCGQLTPVVFGNGFLVP